MCMRAESQWGLLHSEVGVLFERWVREVIRRQIRLSFLSGSWKASGFFFFKHDEKLGGGAGRGEVLHSSTRQFDLHF